MIAALVVSHAAWGFRPARLTLERVAHTTSHVVIAQVMETLEVKGVPMVRVRTEEQLAGSPLPEFLLIQNKNRRLGQRTVFFLRPYQKDLPWGCVGGQPEQLPGGLREDLAAAGDPLMESHGNAEMPIRGIGGVAHVGFSDRLLSVPDSLGAFSAEWAPDSSRFARLDRLASLIQTVWDENTWFDSRDFSEPFRGTMVCN